MAKTTLSTENVNENYKYLLKIHEICDIYEMRKKILLLIRTEVPLWRQLLAEFLGTFVYVLFGNAATAQVFGWNTKNYSLVSWGRGLGMMMAVLVCGTISGAHFNPAVTLALTLVRRFSLFQILLYWIVQFFNECSADVDRHVERKRREPPALLFLFLSFCGYSK